MHVFKEAWFTYLTLTVRIYRKRKTIKFRRLFTNWLRLKVSSVSYDSVIRKIGMERAEFDGKKVRQLCYSMDRS